MEKYIGCKFIDGNQHDWYWNDATHEIIECVGIGNITIGYADNENDAIDFLFATQN